MLHSQKIYFCTDEELAKQQTQCLEILYDYNQTRPSEGEKRGEILQRLLGSVGDNCYLEPPLRANWGLTLIWVIMCTPTSILHLSMTPIFISAIP